MWNDQTGNNRNENILKTSQIIKKLTPWVMEPGGSMPHAQGLSNNPYPEPN